MVGDEIVYIRRTGCCRKAEVVRLHRRGPAREDREPITRRVAREINQNVNATLCDIACRARRRSWRAHLRNDRRSQRWISGKYSIVRSA